MKTELQVWGFILTHQEHVLQLERRYLRSPLAKGSWPRPKKQQLREQAQISQSIAEASPGQGGHAFEVCIHWVVGRAKGKVKDI